MEQQQKKIDQQTSKQQIHQHPQKHTHRQTLHSHAVNNVNHTHTSQYLKLCFEIRWRGSSKRRSERIFIGIMQQASSFETGHFPEQEADKATDLSTYTSQGCSP